MNHIKKALCASGILVFALGTSCENNSLEITDSLKEVDLKILTLDESGTTMSTFESGTDVNFAIEVINNSHNTVEWPEQYSCALIQEEDLFLTYKEDLNHETSSGFLPVGTPFYRPTYCEDIYKSPTLIPPGSKVIIRVSWSNNPGNQILSVGSYYSVAPLELETTDGTKYEWNLRADFKIQ